MFETGQSENDFIMKAIYCWNVDILHYFWEAIRGFKREASLSYAYKL